MYSTSVVQIPRLYWHKTEGRKDISFGETPFSVADSKVSLGQILRFSTASLEPSTSNSGHVRVNVSGSKDEKEGLSMRRLRCL